MTKGQKAGITIVSGLFVMGLFLAGLLYSISREPGRFHWWIAVGYFAFGVLKLVYKITKDLVDEKGD